MKFFVKVLGVSILLTSWMSITSAQELKLKVERYQLKNGMKVLLHEDHSIPMVTVNQWFDVGSYDEEPNRTGLAHFFEHLMFKGTKKFPSGSFDQTLTSLGGENNAFTSRDYTGYYELVPSSALEKILELESDRMVNLSLDADEIQKEREVVKEERRMRVENTPNGFAFETLMTMTFQTHPYEWSVIGSMKDLNATSMEDFNAFYKKYYAPNNATLVLTGDFNSEKAKKWIEKYYGKIPSSQIVKKQSPLIKEQTQRKFSRVAKFDNRLLGMFFLAPGAENRDVFALDILCEALGAGEDSRLYKSLVDGKALTSSVSIWNYTLRHYGSVGFVASVVGKKSFEQVEAEFFKEVGKVAKLGLSEQELKRTKDRLMLAFVTSLQTGSGKGNLLAATELIRGDYTKFFDDLKVYESITNEDVKRVAQRYLTSKRANVLYLGK